MRARRSTRTAGLRLAVAGLAVGLSLAACGGQSLQEQGDAAKANLSNTSALSVTLRLDDPDGDLLAAATSEGDLTEAQATALLGGSFTVHLAGPDGTPLSAIEPPDPAAGVAAGLSSVDAAVALRTGTGPLAEVRLVDGTVYVSLGVPEIDRLSAESGSSDLGSMLDSAPPEIRRAYDDLAAGRWLTLPVAESLEKLEGIFGGLGIEPTPAPAASTGPDLQSLLDSVEPHVSFRDLGASGSTREIEVSVAVKDAVRTLVALGGTAGGSAELLSGFTDALENSLSDAPVKATLTLTGEHVTALRVPLVELLALDATSSDASREKNRRTVGSAAIVLEIDDRAGAVEVPTDVSSLDLGKALSELFAGFAGGFMESTLEQPVGGAGLTPGDGLDGPGEYVDQTTLAEFQACLAAGTDPQVCAAALGTGS